MRHLPLALVVVASLIPAIAYAGGVTEVRISPVRFRERVETLRRESLERPPTIERLPAAEPAPKIQGLTRLKDPVLRTHPWLAHDGIRLQASHKRFIELVRSADPELLEPATDTEGTSTPFTSRLSAVERERRIAKALETLPESESVQLVVSDPKVKFEAGVFDAKIVFHFRAVHKETPIAVVKTDSEAARARKAEPTALVLVEQTDHPLRGVLALNHPARSVRVIDALARTPEEYARAHDQPGDSKDLSVLAELDALGASLVHYDVDPQATPTNGGEMASRIRAALTNKDPDEVVVVLAHVEHGVAHLTDGSRLETSFIMEADGVLIACETANGLNLVSDVHVVTTRALKFNEGRKMALEVVDAVRDGVANGDATYRHVLQQLQQKWDRRSKRPVVKLIVNRDAVMAAGRS